MKSLYKIIAIGLIILASYMLQGCAGARVSGGVGVDMDFGPGGPRLHPTLNVGVYNGGRL